MEILMALMLISYGALGMGYKEGYFKKGSDITRQETIAFEKRALEMQLARHETTHRRVVLLEGGNPGQFKKTASFNSNENKLRAKIAALEQTEEKMGWVD
jgi:hypothetical protein